MRRADAGQAPGNDLAALGYELREQTHVLVVDAVDLLDAEFANLLAAEKLPPAFARSARDRRRDAGRAGSTRSTFTLAALTGPPPVGTALRGASLVARDPLSSLLRLP